MALVKEVDSNWIQARLDGQVGLVPLTYISILEPLSQQDSQDESVSIYALPRSHLSTHSSVYINR